MWSCFNTEGHSSCHKQEVVWKWYKTSCTEQITRMNAACQGDVELSFLILEWMCVQGSTGR